MGHKIRVLALAAACASIVTAVGGQAVEPATPTAAEAGAHAQIPSGREGDLIRYGRNLIVHTRQYAGNYVKAGMDCAACHIDAGTKPHGGSFLGIYATFPQWNKRSKRFITVQDRLQECFLYSMNGNAPPPNSREIIAMTAYIAWLSRGAVVGTGFSGQGFVKVHPAHAPDKANGAGMNTKMPSFVRANMPANAPGSLSDQQAADVSAYVLSHPRPQFVPDRTVTFPSVPAKYF